MVVRQAFFDTCAALREAGIEEDAVEADLLLRLATGKGHLEQDSERELSCAEEETLAALTRRRCKVPRTVSRRQMAVLWS